MKKLSVIGMGYIGLPTSAMFAANGIGVAGCDINADICAMINNGEIHYIEPGLKSLVQEVVLNGRLKASTELFESDVFIIAVHTPMTEDKKADLSYVVQAAGSIAAVLKKGDLVILESTVSPRTTLDVLVPALEKSGLRAGTDFMVAHCPERVLPGQIMQELIYNNRIIGGIDKASAVAAMELYKTFVKGEIYITDATTAELTKLVENTFRDVNIAFSNELAKICENLNINVWDVIEFANKHPRVNIHRPGPGVGGHCLAIDPWFIIEGEGNTHSLIEQARRINSSMPLFVANKVKKLLPKGGRVVLLGCAYKADVEDTRESPAFEIHRLISNLHNFNVEIVDPHVREYDTDIYAALTNANMAIFVVNHTIFKEINFQRLFELMKTPVILDTRNCLNSKELTEIGFKYHLLGNG